MEQFSIEEKLHQGNVVSPKLFTTKFEDEKLNHVRFAVDLIANRINLPVSMLSMSEVGLKITTNKIQFLTNLALSESIKLEGMQLELFNA